MIYKNSKSKQKRCKKAFCLILLLICSFCAFAKVEFSSPTIDTNDDILLTIKSTLFGTKEHNTVVKLNAANKENRLVPLTQYPRELRLLNNANALEVQNSFGTACYDFVQKKIVQTTYMPTISTKEDLATNSITSPNGKWRCYLKKTNLTMAVLILEDTISKEICVVHSDIPFGFKTLFVKWSYDSSFFLYQAQEGIYFMQTKDFSTKPSLNAVTTSVILPQYRFLGKGAINSVEWTEDGHIIYINDKAIYRIDTKGLWTHALFTTLVSIGEFCGELQIDFDCNTDKFFATKDGTRLVVLCSSNAIYCIDINKIEHSVKATFVQPFLSSTQFYFPCYDIYFNNKNIPLICVRDCGLESAYFALYKIENSTATKVYSTQDTLSYALSPKRTKLAVCVLDKITIIDTATWQISKEINAKAFSLMWHTEQNLICVDNETICEYDTQDESDKKDILFLTQAVKGLFFEGNIYLQTASGKLYSYDKDNGLITTKEDATQVKNAKHYVQNGRYRVFVADCKNCDFVNGAYVRMMSTSSGDKTVSLIKEQDTVIPKRASIAVVVDITKDSKGINETLAVLDWFTIKTTFFFNGEFIRRHPKETRMIVERGHKGASMFFTTSTSFEKYKIDYEFIQKGLSRNEDEFFIATKGKELNLYWHLPDYIDNKFAIKVGNDCGYTYINAYCPKDYTTMISMLALYLNCSHDNAILALSQDEKQTGQKLSLLLSALLDAGFDIVDINKISLP